MKLLRFGNPGQEKPGISINDTVFDLSAFGEDYSEHFFATDGLQRLGDYVNAHTANLPLVLAGSRLACPVTRPSKMV